MSVRNAVWTRADRSPLKAMPPALLRMLTTRDSNRISPPANWLRINWVNVSEGIRIAGMIPESRSECQSDTEVRDQSMIEERMRIRSSAELASTGSTRDPRRAGELGADLKGSFIHFAAVDDGCQDGYRVPAGRVEADDEWRALRQVVGVQK